MKSDQAPKKRIALKLLLLLLVCAAPLIGALFLYQSRDSFLFTTKNHGALVVPSIPLEALGVQIPEPRRWLMAYYTPNGCNEACHQVMAHFSTIELSLVKDKPRLGSILLSPNPITTETLPKQPEDLLYFQTNQAPLPPQLLPYTHQTAIWLIDPLGNIILRYEVDALDNRLFLDIRYLLKVSQIG
jgi:hypothetical protein